MSVVYSCCRRCLLSPDRTVSRFCLFLFLSQLELAMVFLKWNKICEVLYLSENHLGPDEAWWIAVRNLALGRSGSE